MDYKRLGKRIKEERLKKNLTQEQLAEAVEISSVYVSHIESGSAKPSLKALVDICNALGITPDFVLYDSLYKSREYIKDEIANLLKDCSEDNLRLIVKLIKAVVEEQGVQKKISREGLFFISHLLLFLSVPYFVFPKPVLPIPSKYSDFPDS